MRIVKVRFVDNFELVFYTGRIRASACFIFPVFQEKAFYIKNIGHAEIEHQQGKKGVLSLHVLICPGRENTIFDSFLTFPTVTRAFIRITFGFCNFSLWVSQGV
jgi:hypothetical protein